MNESVTDCASEKGGRGAGPYVQTVCESRFSLDSRDSTRLSTNKKLRHQSIKISLSARNRPRFSMHMHSHIDRSTVREPSKYPVRALSKRTKTTTTSLIDWFWIWILLPGCQCPSVYDDDDDDDDDDACVCAASRFSSSSVVWTTQPATTAATRGGVDVECWFSASREV